MDKKILEPIVINGMKLKNRIALAPLLNLPRGEDFGIIDKTYRWFEERAKGGAGFMMTGTFIPFVMMSPDAAAKFSKLAETAHAHGAKIGVQITGMGGAFMGQMPSEAPYPNENHPKQTYFDTMGGKLAPTQAMTVEQIKEQVKAVGALAGFLKNTGIDAVELHCAHGGATLQCSFISPFYNRREDEYGGSWENRLRYPTEAVREMREAVGPDYPLFVRLSADELLGEDGITLEDTVNYIVPALEKAGVDCFDISQGSIVHSPHGIEIPFYYPRGCFIHHAAAVKQVTSKPVIGVGRIVEMEMAEKFLQEEKADIIYMGRQLTSDPETPNKYFEGRSDEIRKCIGCLEGCGTPCAINYDIFPDAIPLVPAEQQKKVLVIGGGVAGMEAARVAAERGHKVTLMERESSLGGTVAALAMDPLSMEFQNFIDYLGVMLRKNKVDVRVCKEAGPADIEEINPDAIIVATGASMRMPDMTEGLPGVMDHVTALKNRSQIGRKVVVWGLMYGAELAISLAEEGKEVVLIGEGGETGLASHASNSRKFWIIRRLSDFNLVRVTPEANKPSNLSTYFNMKVEEVSVDSVSIATRRGKKKTIPFDTLIISRGREKNDTLAKELEGKAPAVHVIGDCAAAGNIHKAVFSANEVARKL